jgi:acyl-CoA synthetase (AMP-forming)/AMP-acid ligase II
VTDDGNEAEYGQAGEITVRCEAMFRGYWNDDVRTAEVLRDGWCYTGDVGVIKDGLLFLVDRKKDVIISGGEKVYSLEVENALSLCEGVEKCAVIGIPDPRWGEAVSAVVVKAPDSDVTVDQIRSFMKTRLAGYKCPRTIIYVAELPMLSNGKVDKKSLRATHASPTLVP